MKLNLCLLLAAMFIFGCAPRYDKTNCEFSPGGVDGIERKDIACVMDKDLMPSLKDCANVGLTKGAIDQKVTSKFEINQKGAVQNLSFSPLIKDPEMLRCVSATLTGAVFPTHKSPKPVKVTYPLIFKENK